MTAAAHPVFGDAVLTRCHKCGKEHPGFYNRDEATATGLPWPMCGAFTTPPPNTPGASTAPGATSTRDTADKGGKDAYLTGVDLIHLADDLYDFHNGTDGKAYYSHRGAPVVHALGALAGDLRVGLLETRGKTVGRDALAAAVETIEARTQNQEPVVVNLRCAKNAGATLIDLGGDQFAVITDTGWALTDRPGALFRRTRGTAALPTPQRGGHRDALREILGVPADDPRWPLIWGWLAMATEPDAARAILWFIGTPGSGKTTRAKHVVSVLEPAASLGEPLGTDTRDYVARAKSRYIPTFDNVSKITESMSDILCRLVTGSTFEARELYSDDTLRATVIKRTALATSVSVPYGLRVDALDRIVQVEFDRGSDPTGIPESALDAAFEAAHPAILGALFDDISAMLAALPGAPSTGLPRLADYARGLWALETATGVKTYAAFTDAANEAMTHAADDDRLVQAVIALIGDEWSWKGTPAAALERLRFEGGPNSTKSLAGWLRLSEPLLRAKGIALDAGRSHGKRWVSFTRKPGIVTQRNGNRVPDRVPDPANVAPERANVAPDPAPETGVPPQVRASGAGSHAQGAGSAEAICGAAGAGSPMCIPEKIREKSEPVRQPGGTPELLAANPAPAAPEPGRSTERDHPANCPSCSWPFDSAGHEYRCAA